MEEFSTIASASASASASAGEFKSPDSIWLALAESARSEEAGDAASHDYQPELATPELIVQIRRLLAAERRAGRLVCRYLADLADRIHGQRDCELRADVDEFHAAARFFDLGAREVRERVRVGRALRQLPRIEAAFVAGELSYSRVREVTRVARAETESEWLQRAHSLDMRSLERQVAGESHQLGVGPSRFDAAMGDARDATCGVLPADVLPTDVLPTDVLPTDVLPTAASPVAVLPAEMPSAGAPDEGGSRGTPREPARLHVQWVDRDSLRVTFELSADAWALVERALEGARQKAATPLCDADALAAVARDALGAQNQSADASDPRSTVLLRDHCPCRVPGCNRRGSIDVHQLIPRSVGGEHSRGTCITLSSTHHRRLHDGQLPITGDADAEPRFCDTACHPLPSVDDSCSSPAPLQAGQSPEPVDTPADDSDARATHIGILNEPAARLLQIMGRQSNWTPSDLLEKSALPPGEFNHALLLLELEGRVRRRGYEIDPV